jgi:hypothetical protein
MGKSQPRIELLLAALDETYLRDLYHWSRR